MPHDHPAPTHPSLPGSVPLRWPSGRRLAGRLLIAAGAALAVAMLCALLSPGGYRRFMLAYLTAFAFILSLSLGALCFVLIQHLTRAGWSVLVRRPAEAMAAAFPLTAVMFLPIAISVIAGHGEIYPWARPDSAIPHAAVHPQASHAPPSNPHSSHADAHSAPHAPAGYEHQQLDELTLSKGAWLNRPFFIARWIVYFAIWSALARFFWRHSTAQDRTGGAAPALRMETLAAPATLLVGVTITFAAFDLLMSLNPHWYSTIFGIYYFAGCAVGGFASLILLVLALRWVGLLPLTIGEPHLLDLGRFLFAFMFFWAYIAFSQYLLLWYANLPETTGWLRIRGLTTISQDLNGWTAVACILFLAHFLIPFAGLMSRHVKRRPGLLAFWAAWLLVAHYLDLNWLVMPELGPGVSFGLVEIPLAVGLTLLWLAGVTRHLAGHHLVAVGDPRLHESVKLQPAY